MSDLILLPYDGSAEADVLTRQAAQIARSGGYRILAAVPGLSVTTLLDSLATLRTIVGDGPRVDARLISLNTSDLGFLALADELEPAFAVVPLIATARGRTMSIIARPVLRHPSVCTVAIDTRPETLRAAGVPAKEAIEDGRRGMDRLVSPVLRGGARLHLGLRALVSAGGARLTPRPAISTGDRSTVQLSSGSSEQAISN